MFRFQALILALTLAASVQLLAQNSEPMRAPDGGTVEMIYSIFVAPIADQPFKTTLNTTWTKKLEDGSMLTRQNHRIILRDRAGRIFQERSTLAPPGGQTMVRSFEISDPAKHTKYFCDPYKKECALRGYFPEMMEKRAISPASMPVTPNFTREDLGKKLIGGVEAIGSRETRTIQAGVIGNTAPITISNEYWFSPQLGFNLVVERSDPRSGRESFEAQDLTLTEPESSFFNVPAGYKVVDMRRRVPKQ